MNGDRVTVKLSLDTPVAVGDMTLEWLEVADSRCPLDVVCVWAGEARITLELSRAGQQPARVELVLGSLEDETISRVGEVEIRLLRLEPHPVHGAERRRSDLRAVVELRSVASDAT